MRLEERLAQLQTGNHEAPRRHAEYGRWVRKKNVEVREYQTPQGAGSNTQSVHTAAEIILNDIFLELFVEEYEEDDEEDDNEDSYYDRPQTVIRSAFGGSCSVCYCLDIDYLSHHLSEPRWVICDAITTLVEQELITVTPCWYHGEDNDGEIRFLAMAEMSLPDPDIDGYVYLIHGEGTGYCKIGRSKSVPSRMAQLAIQLPFRIDLIHTIACEGMVEIERALHRRFGSKRANGEWFQLDQKDIEWIKKRDKLYLRQVGWLEEDNSDPFNSEW